MTGFWGGFEKRAVTKRWLDTKMLSGLMTRAGENPKGAFSRSMLRKFDGLDSSGKPWRKTMRNTAFSPTKKDDYKAGIREMNRRTKKDPEWAAKHLEDELQPVLESLE